MDDSTRVSADLALACEKAMKHITAVECDVCLSAEEKLRAIAGVAKILYSVTSTLEGMKARLLTSMAPKVASEDTREMRRRIAAQIGGMGNHPKRNTST